MAVLDSDDFNRSPLIPYPWTKYGSNPIALTGTGGYSGNFGDFCAFLESGTYHLWGFNFNTKAIDHWTSADGLSFTFDTEAISLGTSGAWDDYAVKDPVIVRISAGSWRLYYSGNDGASVNNWKIGYATSTSPNGPWTKYGSNPVLTGANGVNDFAIIYDATDSGNEYRMIYTKGTGGGDIDDIGLGDAGYAHSSDGTTWTDAGTVIALNGQDYEFIKVNGTYHLYYNTVAGTIQRWETRDASSWPAFPVATTSSLEMSGLALGSGGSSDDEACYAPTIIHDGSQYVMYYQGSDGSNHKLHRATAADIAPTWVRFENYAGFSISGNVFTKGSSSTGSWIACRRMFLMPLPYIVTVDLNFTTNEDSGGYSRGVIIGTKGGNHMSVLFQLGTPGTIALWDTSSVYATDTNYTIATGTAYKLRATVTATTVTVEFYNGSWNTVAGCTLTGQTHTAGYLGFYGYRTENRGTYDNWSVTDLSTPGGFVIPSWRRSRRTLRNM